MGQPTAWLGLAVCSPKDLEASDLPSSAPRLSTREAARGRDRDTVAEPLLLSGLCLLPAHGSGRGGD